VIGNQDFKEKYVKKKIDNWIKDVEQLSAIGEDEPQLALNAYTKALCMRWCFVQRTISNVGHLFQPLEDALREKFIPAIVGRSVSDKERRFLALPVRYGGIGILNPAETADLEYATSAKITTNLKSLIVNQDRTLQRLDEEGIKQTIAETKKEKEARFEEEFEKVKAESDDTLKRNLQLACEKGSGAWLTALPIQSLGYVLNKQEFRDSLCLRYGWKIPNTPMYCSCGKRNGVDHALTCALGGYVIMRHNKIRDLEASILKDICKDVKIEPELLPIGARSIASTNTSEKARLDVSAVGIWSLMERTFLDVRIVHPNAPSHMGKDIDKIYKQNEDEKKRTYNQRIIQVEKATFTPLVFSTTGGMASECTMFHKKVAELIAMKTKEEYSHVMNHLRTRLRFSLLKSTLVAVRGERGKQRSVKETCAELSFNMIPDMPSYEV